MHHLKTNPFSDKRYHEYLSNYNGFSLVSLQKNQLCMHINHWLCLCQCPCHPTCGHIVFQIGLHVCVISE